jgi:hypothetical protein
MLFGKETGGRIGKDTWAGTPGRVGSTEREKGRQEAILIGLD